MAATRPCDQSDGKAEYPQERDYDKTQPQYASQIGGAAGGLPCGHGKQNNQKIIGEDGKKISWHQARKRHEKQLAHHRHSAQKNKPGRLSVGIEDRRWPTQPHLRAPSRQRTHPYRENHWAS
jgi:hypothetical protein